MKKLAATYTAIAICLFVTLPINAQAQAAEIASSAATGAVIQQIFADLTSMINKARDDGDYLLARAGVEAKDALDAWQKANGALLDKAFSELDKASRDNIARAHQLVSAANSGTADRLETIQQVTENANQIVESIPLGGKQTYVLRFSPRIKPPQAKESFTLRIRGVNLDKGNPNLHLGNGLAKRDLTGPLEAQFTIPANNVPSEDSKLLVHSFKLDYTTPSESWLGRLFGWRDDVSRELPVVALPRVLGSYQLTGTIKVEKRIEEPFVRDLGQFKAKNSRQYRVAHPKDGWRWDLTKPFSIQQGHGEAGRCEGVDMNGSSENGVNFYAHLDKIQNIKYPKGTDGYVNCALAGIIYRIEVSTDALQEQKGDLTWISDVQISTPANLDAVALKVNTFDGRERIISGTGTDIFFDVRKEPTSLVITPKVPQDIIK